jgi:hypothetical protein
MERGYMEINEAVFGNSGVVRDYSRIDLNWNSLSDNF